MLDNELTAVMRSTPGVTVPPAADTGTPAGTPLELLQNFCATVPALAQIISPQGDLLAVSNHWLQRLGYQGGQVIGRPVTDFLTPSSKLYFINTILPGIVTTNSCQRLPCQLVCQNGRVIDALISATVERTPEGQPHYSLMVIEDVTDFRTTQSELARMRERLVVATEVNEIGIWELDLASGRLSWNDMMFKLFGRAPDGFHGHVRDFERSLHPDDLVLTQQRLIEAIAGQRPLDYDFRIVQDNGTVRHIHARATVFRNANGQAERVLGVNYDVTERKAMEQQFTASYELLRVTLESIGEAVITTDHQGAVRWLNSVAERLSGWPNALANGRPISEIFRIVDGKFRQPIDNPVNRCLSEGRVIGSTGQTILTARDAMEYGVEATASPMRDTQGRLLGAVLVFRDVSEQRRLSDEMSYRAKHDELTGLINRSEFERLLARALNDCRHDHGHHALMYIDLDQFKLINDTCGHSVGDQLLRQVTTLLKARVRAGDIVARLGGDEFGIIATHCAIEQAEIIAEKICDDLEEFRFNHDGRRFRIGASIGLVGIDSHWPHAAAVLQAADTACYAAKDAGRNRVHSWTDTDQTMRLRRGEIQWASKLEQALDDDRFELFGQLIVPLRPQGDEGLHLEVLLRLREIDGTLVPPGAFFSAAERFHMASRLDRHVLRKVCAWLENDPAITAKIETIAINLSGQSIGDRAFHRHAAAILSQAGFDISKLCLEITETAAITNLGEATAFIEEMRSLGVRIALDDFGAGASSFGYLKALPVDYLKIDGQFIRDLIDDPLDYAAVRCFREVAAVVGVKTVAEFVEQEDVRDELRRIGIDFAQGYLLHRPEPLTSLVQRNLLAPAIVGP